MTSGSCCPLLCSSFYGMCSSVFELILCVESLISASRIYQLPYCPSVNNDSQTQCGCIQTFLQYVICMSVCACAESRNAWSWLSLLLQVYSGILMRTEDCKHTINLNLFKTLCTVQSPHDLCQAGIDHREDERM